MKLLNWLNEPNSPEFVESTEKELSPALRRRLEELNAVPVTKVMVTRPLIMALDADVQLRRVKRLKSSKVRYFPVYRGDLDRVLGWIEKSKVIELLSEGREEDRLENHLQPIARISEKAMAAELADTFLNAKSPIVFVENDLAQTVGMVTLPDFIELLFGFDVEGAKPTPTSEAQPKSYEI